MFEALSTSRWKWTWWFLLVICASVLVCVLAALLSVLFHINSNRGATFYVAAVGFAGLAVGIIGALVSFVMTMLRHHSPPAKPVG
jgi:Na+/melibiose symporter-like transporter